MSTAESIVGDVYCWSDGCELEEFELRACCASAVLAGVGAGPVLRGCVISLRSGVMVGGDADGTCRVVMTFM